MAKKKSANGLIAAIMFAAVVVSGSLVFFGMQMTGFGGVGDDELATQIQAGIAAYVENAQGEYEAGGTEAVVEVDINQDLSDDDPFIGDANAPVTIVEFSNFQCGWCQHWFENTLPLIKEKYINTGKVKFVYRDFAPSGYPAAQPAAYAANCAREQGGDEMYFAYHDEIFDNQSALGNGERATFMGFAENLGLDTAAFGECFDSGKYVDEVNEDMAVARGLGIQGTPGFTVNSTLVRGAEEFSVFEEIIEAELAK